MQRHPLPFGKTESLTSSKWSQKVSQINFFANKCDFQATINNFVLPSSWQCIGSSDEKRAYISINGCSTFKYLRKYEKGLVVCSSTYLSTHLKT